VRPGTVSDLAPWAVVLPVLMAGFVLIAGRHVPRRVVDVVAVATAAAVAMLSAVLAVAATHGRAVTWAGGWHPRAGVSVGIVLVADPLGPAWPAWPPCSPAAPCCTAGAIWTTRRRITTR
jgi:formate hydrogenlyase subunit 3/multisubunit Na+/H+ antiporter MnhD subunit